MPSSSPTKRQSTVPRHVRTRRHLWLAANGEYFERGAHSLALPLAYDRLVRAYQSPEQRQAEGKSQGWARMLEGALLRGEAKLGAATEARQTEDSNDDGSRDTDTMKQSEKRKTKRKSGPGDQGKKKMKTATKTLKPLPEENVGGADNDANAASLGSENRRSGSFTDAEWDVTLGIAPAEEILTLSPERQTEVDGDSGDSLKSSKTVIDGIDSKTALARWRELLTQRFVSGDDEDIDYEAVDSDRMLDGDWQELERQQEWFEDETETWEGRADVERPLEGETGIQDF